MRNISDMIGSFTGDIEQIFSKVKVFTTLNFNILFFEWNPFKSSFQS